MLQVAEGWELYVDHSPEWLFVRIERMGFGVEPTTALSESLWTLGREHRLDRFIIELGPTAMLTSYLIGQLILLHKRAHLKGGVMRVCGLSSDNYRVLEQMRLADRFPNYASREDAVMGRYPNKPR